LGAQTERSRNNFKIGPPMPHEIIEGFAYLKKAAAYNCDLGILSIENGMRLQQSVTKY
jgi:fumarate hydratase class II